jgi:hypothetical protein
VEDLSIVDYNLALFTIFNDFALNNGGKFSLMTPEEETEADNEFLNSAKNNPIFKNLFASVN